MNFLSSFPTLVCALIVGGILGIWLLAFMCKGFLLSSTNKWTHAFGGSIKHKLFVVMMAVCLWFCTISELDLETLLKFSILLVVVFFSIWIALGVKQVLMKDERAKNDTYNFRIQTFVLLMVGVGIVGTVLVFDIGSNFLPFGIFASLMGWIFQDIIMGVAAFYHMYWNNLIHIGDWIEIPSKGVDGVVKNISLVNVTIQNWDDTMASIPTATLQKEHMKNLQNMLSGKTLGRRMMKSFIIDSSTVKSMDFNEVQALGEKLEREGHDLIWMQKFLDKGHKGFTSPVLNVTLFRLHLLHWLMNHDKISRKPRLMARLMEPTAEGLPLQVYAFLTEHSLQPYELVQSEVMEYVVMSMGWFGLRLYQRPTGYDLTKNLAQ